MTDPSRLRVLLVSAEVASLARTGGLGDVVEALGLALAELGMDVVVVTPRYGTTKVPDGAAYWPAPLDVHHGFGAHDWVRCGVLEAPARATGAGGSYRVCLLVHDGLYGDRQGIYGDAHGAFGDNERRFALLSRGALDVAREAFGGPPDVVHAHDWHAALAVSHARTLAAHERRPAPGLVFTIHNLGYQGQASPALARSLGVPDDDLTHERFLHDGALNLMKGAIVRADLVTTVSPTYAWEIRQPAFGFGLDAHLRAHAGKLVGIANGIDVASFDPATDAALPARYDAESFVEGRAANKAALARELGLAHDDGPIFATVSRLVHQKGIDLLLGALPQLVGSGARVVLVGTGEPALEQGLEHAARRFPGRVASRVAFDGALARRVYAGADFFVVPSRFEPCGLTQLYAMRYGSIPVVSDTGGLHDTVKAPHEGPDFTGVRFDRGSWDGLLWALGHCLALYGDAPATRAARRRGMLRDSAWTTQARAYLELYRHVAARARPR